MSDSKDDSEFKPERVNSDPERAIWSAVASKEWRQYTDLLAPIGERLNGLLTHPEDPLLRQEQYRQLFSFIQTAYWHMLFANPDNPDFCPFWYNFGAPNPDDLYTQTPIRGDGVYKISGYRGSTHIFTFSIGSGPFSVRGIGDRMGVNLAEYDLDTMQIEEDGRFEILLSAEKPEGHEGNWWYLDPKGSYILVRQRFYDWRNEVSGRLAIQSLDQPIIRPRQTAHQLEADMRQIAVFVENWAKWSIEFANRAYRLGYVNKVELIGYYDIGGYQLQKYVIGMWDIQPDEALIYETELPEEVRYWAIELLDELWCGLDHGNMNRQESLNGHSAKVDSDGKFRAVLCHDDPGVPNWLDTAGYQRGGVFGRWQEASSYPQPVCKVVKFADIRNHLPKDTPVVTPEERDVALRYRRESYQMRHRWN